jgi:TolB-like protein
MSFFEELKRRNVVRVGIAYAVAAWVLLQIFDVVGEILELPAWGGKLILVTLILGFVLALIFAWAYELTPEGVKREKDVDRSRSITPYTGRKLNALIFALMAIAIAYLLFDKFYLAPRLEEPAPELAVGTPQAPTPPGADQAAPQPAASRQSIAVLPFDNRSRVEDDAYFVDGIHDDLLTSLARIGSLKVISRTSVAQYRGTTKTIPQIAGELGVATVMEGAVQRAGNTVRINVQLIDAQTDEHLWAEIFDRELTADNLFAIQSEISEEIARALQATLSPEEQQRLNERPTDNLAAYNAYLRGRQLLARGTSADVDQAAAEFRRAVELDPEFALAWVGVSESASLQSQYSDLDWVEAMEISQEASDRALALDDQLGEAYLGRASVLAFYGRDDEAEAAYRKAIELSPGYAPAYQWFSGFLSQFPNRLAESVGLGKKALDLDPLSSVIRQSLAYRYITMGRYEEAERELDRLLELDPGFVSAFGAKALLASQRGQVYDQVHSLQRILEADPGRMGTYAQLIWAYLDLDYIEPLEDVRRKLLEINEEHPLIGLVDLFSGIYFGNYDGALESARWTYARVGRPAYLQRVIGYINAMKGDFPAARQAFEIAEPRFFDPEQWRAAIETLPEDACFAGILLLRTGDEELGQQLLERSVDYLQNELPRYIEHADRYDVESCLLALGRKEAALAGIETRVSHGHLHQWWLWRRWPSYEPLWGDPRFEALMAGIEQDIAAQRARLIETAAL